MQLIDWLDNSGHRLSTGAPNSSGTVRALQPGTNATASVFDGAGVPLTQPVELDAGGRATVYTDSPVDLEFEDADGANVGNVSLANVHGAESVSVDNAGFTGGYLDTLLTAALTSFNGQDWKLKESAGATARGLADTVFGIQIPAKGFGAAGDGLTVDTSAIQIAINRCSARGGGRVYLDPGTYLLDAQLTLPANVSLIGAGSAVSILKQTNATANGILVSAAGVGNNTVQGIAVTHSTTSTGIGISCVSTSRILLQDVHVVTAKFATGVKFDACLNTSVQDSFINSKAAGRAVYYTTSGSQHLLLNTDLGASGGSCVEYDVGGGGGKGVILGCSFSAGTTGVVFTSGVVFRVIACTGLFNESVTTAFSVVGTDPGLYQHGNDVDGYTVNVASGATFTPDRLRGNDIRARMTSTGVACPVAAPTPNPAATARNVDLTLTLYNNAGGAITGWSLNAIYHVSAAPSSVDGDLTVYRLRWDADASVWRQISRSVST